MTQEEIEAITDETAAKALETRANNLWNKRHSLKDLIALENHRGSQEALEGDSLPIRFFKTRPPGAV